MGSGGVAVFRGIPYGQEPIGELRWRPPLPRKRWSGVKDAVANGKTNIVPDCFIDETDEGAEDEWRVCLLGRYWSIYLICTLWVLLLGICWREKKKDIEKVENDKSAQMLLSEVGEEERL